MNKKTFRAAVLAALLAVPCAASAAVDYFLKIDGVEGESTDVGHKGEINVESWSWGVSSSTSGNGASRAGKPCVSSFNFTKMLDKASPQLMANAVSGMSIKSAVLTARKAGEKPQEYLKVTLENVLVSSYSAAGSSDVPVDQFSLNFTKMTVEYKVQKPDGTLGDPSTASFQGGC